MSGERPQLCDLARRAWSAFIELEITQGLQYHAYGPSRGGIRGADLHLGSSAAARPRLEAGAVVRIDLATLYVAEIVGAISDRDVKRAERLVARHAARLRREWTKIHGNDGNHSQGS